MSFYYSDPAAAEEQQPPASTSTHWYRFCGRYFTDADLMLVLASIFFPPLAIYLQKGFSAELLISFLLTSLGQFPGLFYALYLIWSGGRPTRVNLEASTVNIQTSGPQLLLYDEETPARPAAGPTPAKPAQPAQPAQPASQPATPVEGTTQEGTTAPPTYEEATHGKTVPPTGDYKVQR